MVEKFIMAGDTPLHLCDSEQGDKVVVLLHGYLESMLVWDDFIPLIYKKVRVVTIDLPGHGISHIDGECHTMEYLAKTVHLALEQLSIDKYTIVGHSMGGYVALALCELYPQHLDGIVLLSSTPNADTSEKIENRNREIQLIQSGKKEALSKICPSAGFAAQNRHRLTPYIDDLVDQVMITEDEGAIALLRGMILRKDQNQMLRQSTVRQLFIFGEMDDYIPLTTAQQISNDHPQAQVVWLAQSGHMGFIEEAQACAEALLRITENC